MMVFLDFVCFFQAEDGIRDYKVTGVQTCALPIYAHFMQHPEGREALAPETFRPWIALRTVVMGAATLWIAVFFALAVMQGATRSSFFSAAFFVVLFTACSLFYNRLAFIVSDSGLTVRTVAMERTVSFSDILRVDVMPGLIGTSSALRTRLGS